VPGAGQFGPGVLLGGEGGLGLGGVGKGGFPPGFQGAGDEPVFRFSGQEGALGAAGGVAGALGGQLGSPQGPVVAGGDLAGGGQRERDLGGGDRGEQGVSDGGVDGVGPYGAALGGDDVVAVGLGAGVAGMPALVLNAHALPAAAAVDDALAQGGALAGRAGAGAAAVGGQFLLVGLVVVPGDVSGASS